jgi:hypothetical protein
MMQLLLCNTLAEGHAVPSRQRQCTYCDAALWVSTGLVPAVDTRELAPICAPCLQAGKHGQPITGFGIHPDQLPQLAEAGILNYAKRKIDTLNTRVKKRRHQ